MTLTPEDIEALARSIARKLDDDDLLDVDDLAAWFKKSPRYVAENMVTVPGFPTAIRLTVKGGKRSYPAWRRGDIKKYIASHQNGKTTRGGRPRNN